MKAFGNFVASVLVLLAIIFLVFLFYKGAQFLSAFIAPLTFISPTVIGIGIILVILSLIPGLTKPLLAPILVVSYILGFFLFIYSAYLTLNVFNVVWLIVGILLCGFGIVPIAIIACIVSAAWPALWHILIMLLAAALFRVYVAKRAVDLAR
jgi:hypothetical protein